MDRPPCSYECPIALTPCDAPCIASDGFTYDQDAIMNLLALNMVSPMTREPLDIRLVPNTPLLRRRG